MTAGRERPDRAQLEAAPEVRRARVRVAFADREPTPEECQRVQDGVVRLLAELLDRQRTIRA